MVTARIREAGVPDAQALAELHDHCWRETYGGAVPAERIESVLADNAERWERRLGTLDRAPVWLAHREGRAVGFAAARSRGVDDVRSLELTMLYLRADEQGSGTADNLLNLAIGDAPALLWVWDGNPRALAFYARHGFAVDGAHEVFAPLNLPTIRMVR